MYKEKKTHYSRPLLVRLQEKYIFEGSRQSLWRILNIGFQWKKDNLRRGLTEMSHIVFKRINFLRSYIDMKEEGLFNFVFMDETWIFQDGTISKS
jgi:hypothetical protein